MLMEQKRGWNLPGRFQQHQKMRFSLPAQKSAPSPASPKKKSAGASSWSWKLWRPAWTWSPPATSCRASAPTWGCPSRCRWRPPSSPGRRWSSTWCPAGAPSQWPQQPSTWPPRLLQRRRPRKVSAPGSDARTSVEQTQDHRGNSGTDTRSAIWPRNVRNASTEIGDIAGVADVTIRQSYRLIYPRAAELFPPDFKFDTPVDKLPLLWGLRPQLKVSCCSHGTAFLYPLFCWSWNIWFLFEPWWRRPRE